VLNKPVTSVEKHRLLAVMVILATVCAMALPKSMPFIGLVDDWLYDLRVGYLTPPQGAHPDIVLITVTEETLARFPFRSPLDRRFLGDVIAHVADSGARAIGIDYLFDQPTRPADDRYLHQVFRQAAVPLIIGEAAPQTALTPKQRAFQSAFLADLRSAYVNLTTDRDGTVRRAYRGQGTPENWKPGLADAVAAAAGETVDKGPLAIAYYPARQGTELFRAFRSFPAETVPLLPRAWFKNKIVLFGAELAFDDRVLTPFSRTAGKVPGLYVHAYTLAQILDHRRITVPSIYAQLGLATLLSIMAVVLAQASWSLFLRWGLIGGGLFVLWAAAIGVYYVGGYLVPLTSPTLAVVFGAGLATIYLGYQERQKKRFARQAFARYVSPNLVEDIINNPDRLELAGERRFLTFIFTDLAGFTSLAEQLDPTEIVSLLNGYIDAMCAIIFRHGGTVDKIVGDAVVAYWGAPVRQEEECARAVACALEMDAFSEDYRHRHPTRAGLLGQTRIGINSGTAIIGNFGGETFFDYTAHGDTVNTAARLEGANKYLGTRICVGQETRNGCPQQAFRSIADLILKGKSEPIRVYEPVPKMPAEHLAAFEEAFVSLSQDAALALGKYQDLLRRFPDDPVARLHIDRLGAGQTGTRITLAGK